MLDTHPSQQRSAKRLEARFRVRFTLNDGPEEISDTINFTYRSLAIRSDAKVEIGDKVVARVGELPALYGDVIRVFDEGFAIRLKDMSLALVAYARTEKKSLRKKGKNEDVQRIRSPMFKVQAAFPSWARIATAKNSNALDRHHVSIITTDTVDVNEIQSVWVSINETRWIARVLQANRRGRQSVIVILLNDWQLHMASEHGLSFSIICSKMNEWAVKVEPSPIAQHMEMLEEKSTIENAATG